MIRINIHEAKTHLSRYLGRLARGEVIVLCKHNIPIAEIRGLATARSKKRPVGLAGSTFEIPPGFFDPLPEELLRGFEGNNSAGPRP